MTTRNRFDHPPDGWDSLDVTERRTSNALTSARTVLSRAKTELLALEKAHEKGGAETHYEHVYEDGKYAGSDVYQWEDPAAGDIREALAEVVRLLAPFERLARPSKR